MKRREFIVKTALGSAAAALPFSGELFGVPSSVPKRGIQQYVMAEAERIEKKFKYGVEESDQTKFEQYAENWLKRQEPFFKATTYAGYKRDLGIVYPLIGGIPLAKLLPMTLEEMLSLIHI